jgi:hypothetical protein
MRIRRIVMLTNLVALSFVLVTSGLLFPGTASAQKQVPIYEVDPFWPKTPLPNNWVLGNVIGTAVDPSNDHVWIIHRPAALTNNEIPLYHNPPTGEDCCMPAPPILEFDADGNLVGHFGPLEAGGPNWADAEHGMFVDHLGNIWTGGGGTGASSSDSAVFKFAQDGTLLKRFGTKGMPYSSADLANFGRPADFWVQEATNELWVADGYTNRRLIVLDATTGEYKRHWGAYGNVPDDAPTTYDPQAPPSQQFRPPVHCVVIADDGLVYMCDRGNDRIQVFQQDGTFVKERFIAKNTTSAGSVWDMEFSKDADQQFIFLVDGINHRIRVLDRQTLDQVSEFGHHGRWAGGFYAAHSIGMDSKQNIYIGETWEGKRVQKFVYRGMGPAN